MSGVLSPTPSQKSLMPPPVPVDSTTGAGKPAFCAEALGNRGGEGKDGGGADDLDLLLLGDGSAGKAGRCDGKRRGGGEKSAGHGRSPCLAVGASGTVCPPPIPYRSHPMLHMTFG